MVSPSAAALIATISPSGHLHLAEEAAAPPIDDATRASLEHASSDSEGQLLLTLAGTLAAAALPPSLAWVRELAHHTMAAVCALPDLGELRAIPAIALAPERASDLLERLPPMPGAEYVDTAVLERLSGELTRACQASLVAHKGSVEEWLHQVNPLWNSIGRVHFHLAERKDDAQRPFAFLATYTTRVSKSARPQHLPLGQALAEYSGAGNRAGLLSLLQPVQRASDASETLRALVDSGQIYHPLAWSPAQALAFLREVPLFEKAGIVVRVPDWWKASQPPRPQVRVTVGAHEPRGLGLDALLDFNVDVALDGQTLDARELQELLRSAGGLVKLRGRWVELDAGRLGELLAHWSKAQKAHRSGLSFLESMRLLAGVEGFGGGPDTAAAAVEHAWSERVAGPWLEEALRLLRAPDARDGMPRAGAVLATLRPYQVAGVSWLYHLSRLGLGGCLADDMGLGKTLQVLTLMLRLKEDGERPPHLLVVPASLMANWEAEARRFTPHLDVLVAHPSVRAKDRPALTAKLAMQYDVVVTSYGYLSRLEWAREMTWDLIVLDEAQAIKNPGAAQSRLVKSLKGRARLALTGTPIENRLGDLWSLFDFLNPGLLGAAKTFTDRTRSLAVGAVDGYAPLRRLVRPYILRRMKTDRTVVADLPEKTEVTAYCSLTRVQAALYQQAVVELAGSLETASGMQRRGQVLAFLTRFKQICNHPSQVSGDGRFRPEDSAKFARLGELCEPLAQRQEKVLVFTQYREMTEPLAEYLARVFGRPGLVLHGGTPVAARKKLVERFQDDETVGFLVLSLKAGGTGLNLTAATHVVHFDRWWNPAVEDQATDRAHRIGQRRAVMVHKFTCRGTVEERIEAMLGRKRALSRELLAAGGEVSLTELSDRELIDLVHLDIDAALAEH